MLEKPRSGCNLQVFLKYTFLKASLFFGLVFFFFSCTLTLYFLHHLEWVDRNFISMSLRYGPWSGWNLSFSLLQNVIVLGKATILVMWIFMIFFSTKFWNSYFQPIIWKIKRFDTSYEVYYFPKKNACKMIWWRPKIDPYSNHMDVILKLTLLKLSLVCQHNIEFLIHTL